MAVTALDFVVVERALRAILVPYADRLHVAMDLPGGYSLRTGFTERWKKALEFGATRIGRAYVSYYLFPVYMRPELLNGISEALRARMQGKSCFNFKTVDDSLLVELAALTAKGYAWYREEGFVG